MSMIGILHAIALIVTIIVVAVGIGLMLVVRKRNGARIASMGSSEQAGCSGSVFGINVPVGEAERRFIEAMPDAVIITNALGVVQYLSPGAAGFSLVDNNRLAMRELSDMLERVVSDGTMREREIAFVPNKRSKVSNNGRGIQAGSAIPRDTLHIRARIDEIADGLYVIFLRDMSEQRRFEAMRRDFLTNVSHELKTPAGAIALLSETITDAADDPDAVRYFSGRISKEAERLIELIKHQIDLQRAQQAHENLQLRPVSTLESVREAVEQNLVQAHAKNINIRISMSGRLIALHEHGAVSDEAGRSGALETVDASEQSGQSEVEEAAKSKIDATIGTPQSALASYKAGWETSPTDSVTLDSVEDIWVMADSELLVRALKNLVENAIRYSPERTTVAIGITKEQERVFIRVVDQGIGIPQQSLDRVFERFYRVDPARSRQTGGSGLGLSIVRHCIQECSGSVSVWSREGEGSTFTVELPVASPADPAQESESA